MRLSIVLLAQRLLVDEGSACDPVVCPFLKSENKSFKALFHMLPSLHAATSAASVGFGTNKRGKKN